MMVDYTMIMIARKEHEELARKGTSEYSVRSAHTGLLRGATSTLGGVLIDVGGWLKAWGEPRPTPAQVEA
jgi:hypothetical protein